MNVACHLKSSDRLKQEIKYDKDRFYQNFIYGDKLSLATIKKRKRELEQWLLEWYKENKE